MISKKTFALVVALIVLFFLAIAGCIGCFFIGRGGGWNDGYSAGYNQGKDDGIEEGKKAGYDEGYKYGHSEGFTSGQRY